MALATARHQTNAFALFDTFDDDIDTSKGANVNDFRSKLDNSCPECNNKHIATVNGVEMCMECGIIIGNAIDLGAEWRNDTNGGEDKTRCGMPINNMLPESSYSTGMGFSYGGKNRKQIYAAIQQTFLWQSQPYHERSLKGRFDNINQKCQEHGVSDAIIEFTQTIYYDVLQELDSNPEHTSKRGNNNEGLQGAALFQAFQEDGHPKTYKEIAAIFEIEPEYVSEGIKLFRTLMGKTDKYHMKSNKYSDYIEGFCRRLHLEDLKDRVMEVADKAHELGILDSNTPTAIVAGCIYYVIVETGNATVSKNTIYQRCGVSVPTITKVCDKLCQRAVDLS